MFILNASSFKGFPRIGRPIPRGPVEGGERGASACSLPTAWMTDLTPRTQLWKFFYFFSFFFLSFVCLYVRFCLTVSETRSSVER